MQKIVLIALLCATAYATAGTVAAPLSLGTAPADGFLVTTGVVQACHHTCLTCTGFLASECASCTAPLALSSGTCVCAADKVQVATAGTDALPTLTCSGTASDAAKCKTYGGLWFSTDHCAYCDSKCMECATDAVTCRADAAAVGGASMVVKGCWGATTNGADQACVYTAAKAYLPYSALEFDQTDATASALKGYYYTASTFTYTVCAKGCLTCSSTAVCSTCATNFTVNTGATACECSATGFFTTAATTTALDLCTACQTGCTTCSSATVCTVCDSSNELGSTTDSSSTCQALATTDATTTDTSATSTTDGESSMTATTDASTTNGVLITAASVLLAVILA